MCALNGGSLWIYSLIYTSETQIWIRSVLYVILESTHPTQVIRLAQQRTIAPYTAHGHALRVPRGPSAASPRVPALTTRPPQPNSPPPALTSVCQTYEPHDKLKPHRAPNTAQHHHLCAAILQSRTADAIASQHALSRSPHALSCCPGIICAWASKLEAPPIRVC
jgi:hypothetical protein